MSRYATSQRGGGGSGGAVSGCGGGHAAVAMNMLHTIAAKEDNYKEGIKINHTMAKNAAKRIRDLEQMLLSSSSSPNETMMDGIMTKEELTAFFREQKDAVKTVAEGNVTRERYVNTFVSAVRTVQQQVSSKNNSRQNGDDDDGMVDYQKAIEQAMLQQHQQGSDDMNIEIHQESSYRDVAEALGEPVTVKKNRKKRKSNRKNDDDDDDDIQVVQTETQGGGLTLKCPITGAYMEDAVRNKVCSHVYSLAGITAHIHNARTKKNGRHNRDNNNHHYCQCPVAGCVNQSVSQSQLETDVETVLNVRREKRQQDKKAQQQQASQATELINTDDEEE